MKPGRKLDRKQTNRRQKYELDDRAKRWRCTPKLAVILADMYADETGHTFEWAITTAKETLRRANREPSE